MKTKITLLVFFACSIWACAPSERSEQKVEEVAKVETKASISEGSWRAVLTLKNGIELPFNFTVALDGKGEPKIDIINGEEKLSLDEVKIWKDSISIPMHIFDAEIIGKLQGGKITGKWVKHSYKKPYEIPFKAVAGVNHRFDDGGIAPMANITGKWQVSFENEEGDPDQAIGVFEQKGSKLLGTFLTTTGDYRYLEGSVIGNELHLSCFDGEHAFLFTAKLDNGLITDGMFYSGKHWEQPWTAIVNENASLPDAGKLTYLKDGYDKVAFSFPNLDGEPVSLEDQRYKGKVVVVQLLGSWCPNCMDETKFLAPFYQQYQPKGFEVIGLAYERNPEFNEAKKRVSVMKDKLGVDYEVLIAGVSSKVEAAKSLPMLNHVMSFPTTIIIDKTGEVRKIHTGFSGPGTGEYYQKFVDEFTLTIEKLLAEEA
ncbi:TlpA disulfide reductase family protein [Flammeovirgaceae bacterium SG7u.111]|nr:TlpA disulfide reductase family protein [Flammeovirgaceae bacterium SG7u.132]WPO38679.1 TlpA disulfide reductase family protein [Flammeovirgaceae bacterium SG7u.111]